MQSKNKHSYLQSVSQLRPELLNRVLNEAMQHPFLDIHDATPPVQRMTSMQPSLYAPQVDPTKANLGFGRIGLRKLLRDLHNSDPLIQVQSVHTLMDRVHFPDDALFLIRLNVVLRIADLMKHKNVVIRERVCLILYTLCTFEQGRQKFIGNQQNLIKLRKLINMREKKEVRYQAAQLFKLLSDNVFGVEKLLALDRFLEELLALVKEEYVTIVLLHLHTVEALIDWEQQKAIDYGAFEILMTLITNFTDREFCAPALRCLAKLLKHKLGKLLADENDFVRLMRNLLFHKNEDVIYGAVKVLMVCTLTVRSKWRSRECLNLAERLVQLAGNYKNPPMQLGCFRVLTNICDHPDVRKFMRIELLEDIEAIKIRNHEEWDGTSPNTTFTVETGHNYRTICIENVETIMNQYGDSASAINVHSYLRELCAAKENLLKCIKWKSYRMFRNICHENLPNPIHRTMIICWLIGNELLDNEIIQNLGRTYNVDEALRRRRISANAPISSISLWSEEECRNFENGLKAYGKDFHSIQQHKVHTRSVGELVQFYYIWKKTERHDIFANKARLEKKKYTLHPGHTDYMDRFLEEQDGGNGHDRSASPL